MSAIALAKRLRQRGHAVWIISTPDVEEMVRAEEIEFRPVLAGLFPSGSFAAELRSIAALSWFAKLREGRRLTRVYRSILNRMLASRDNEIDQAFDRIDPDLVLSYSDVPTLVVAPLVALRRGLRCAYVTPLFYSYRGPASPPMRVGLVPRPGFWSGWAVRWAWTQFLTKRNAFRQIDIVLGLDVNLPQLVRQLAPPKTGAGHPVHWDCFLAPKLSLPEFFLAPRELEFDFEPRAESHWLGWCFDADRAEPDVPSDPIDRSRPLVYCAMGTQFLSFVPAPRRRAFLQAVIDAFAARPHLQLALATGGALEQQDVLEVNAPGAIVRERLPQLQMLNHAKLMITHCGLHSLMECAARGVPMIAFPLGFDQFGNAARVVYHGLGLRGDFRRATAESIGRLIDEVLADEAMSQRCEAMATNARNHAPYESELAALEALAATS
ncbi:UDP:flavonoid glycosyltransferase YjiC, YdhE family [Singulisphaera sp. GP187]|uniref:nucleotide disphospho-sugar-binding domain-containing protein n=1 Tax=Singulisphaera sp. GP187 TaxID=1882752 RepID=UPI00092BD95A|nr:glycosyltransferase [Singulisphaera sp. GP187]SIN70964.1 UDP:flavonoid glycosyltransferase YjiC, YdhE family [Singulisphaera sp. GP187]